MVTRLSHVFVRGIAPSLQTLFFFCVCIDYWKRSDGIIAQISPPRIPVLFLFCLHPSYPNTVAACILLPLLPTNLSYTLPFSLCCLFPYG